MIVYVAINFTRDHQTEIVGVASSIEKATEMVEQYRKEPLYYTIDGGLNTCPTSGPADTVGHIKVFIVDYMH